MSHCPIQVVVVSEYLPAQSAPDRQKFAFAYHVTIENNGTESAQLISRHWIITDSNGKRQEVRGLGVIGLQPMIQPGQAHRYTSGSVLDTEVGTMEGSYHMITPSGLAFDAPIPVFLLAVPGAVH
ncbi:MAG: Co2+/Mg2+ efflux protein ApaG [Porticoccaceae bacterium]